MRHKFLVLALITTLFPFPLFARSSNDPYSLQWAYTDIGLTKAWDVTVGKKDVVVAVVDNGFDSENPDLRNNVWKNPGEIANNNIDDDKNGFVDDVTGWDFAAGDNNPRPDEPSAQELRENDVIHHATLVAGLIGASADNNRDGVGVNWHVSLMNVRVVDNSGIGDLDPLGQGIRYAVQNGADIINISIIANGDITDLYDDLEYAYEHQVAVVAAAGNNGESLDLSREYPICLDAGGSIQKVLGVSAIERSHRLANFSNFGGDCIDITAPGTEILSTLYYAPEFGFKTEYSGLWSGTSFAAPLVSGAAALIKSIQPTWGAKEIYTALQSTTHRTPTTETEAYAELFGAGLLQVDAALVYAEERLPSAEMPKTFLLFSQTGSRMSSYNFAKSTQKVKAVSVLASTTEFVQVEGQSDFRYVSLRPVSGGNEVVFLDQNLKTVRTTPLSISGSFHLGVGDFTADKKPEIVLSPTGPSELLYALYTFDGKKIAEKVAVEKHRGTLQTVTTDESTGDTVISLLVKGLKNNHRLLTFSASGETTEFLLDGLTSPTDLARSDMDGDSQEEYIFAYTDKKASKIAIFGSDGVKKSEFTPFVGYKSGVSISSFTYLRSGANALLVAPQKGKQPVRIVMGDGTVVRSWWPFGKNFSTGFRLVKGL